ncbi:teicoplanin resistance protein VanZ [Enterococcus florum]|uniref:Teicoplanin resistance protein VanZ n=1 Tax=Enterococcus florum TaxID=2480627 RepID=A0A4P5PBK9_9ENTE|nr:VanZ family protein [Enterococcus florum]GCF93671.1 teicoplanin resistance protein VanZ [Enterococcus florum]
MNSYTYPIHIALIVFPFLALVITIPILLYYYHKYGTLGKLRSLVLYSFVFYLISAYFLVILPLPSINEVAEMTGPTYQLHLGESLQNFLSQTVLRINQPDTYLPALRQSVFLEPVFNIFLVFPFGIYGRYYFRFSWKKTIFLSFCLSLFFELTQLSGLYFIYPRPYRLFDVNDLLHNTLGGALGYFCAPLFTFFLPTRSELDHESFEKGKQVTLLRRAAAAIVDWFLLDLFQTVFNITAVYVPELRNSDLLTGDIGEVTSNLLKIVLYFMIGSYLMHGQTLGKKLVKIKVEEIGKPRVQLWALVKRYSAFYLLLFVTSQIFQFSWSQLVNTTNHRLFIAYMTFGLISLGILLLFTFNLLYALIRRKHRLFHEKVSHTYTVSTVKEKEVKHADI